MNGQSENAKSKPTRRRNSKRPSSSNNKSGPNNNRKKRRGPRGKKASGTGERLTGFEKVERGYLNLLEKHLESRKKYFELFHRADPRQLEKLERVFYRTQSELREYEENIKPEYQEEFKAKYNGKSLDLTYSTNHEISAAGDDVEVSDPEDPHYLPSQESSQFVEDTEESVGSIEDYQRYKGIEESS